MIIKAIDDINQLKNPENVNDIFKFKDYANHCIDLLLEKKILCYMNVSG